MANWRLKIHMVGLLDAIEDLHDWSVQEAPVPQPLLEVIAREADKAVALRWLGEQIRKAKSTAELNRTLCRIYDEADRLLIWCGGLSGPPEDFDKDALAKQLEAQT